MAWVGFEPTTTEFLTDARPDWALRPWVQLVFKANFIQLLQFHHLFGVRFNFRFVFVSHLRLFNWLFFFLFFFWGNYMIVAEWTDMYGIHHWMIVWSSYRKFLWVVFEPTIPEFRSDPLTDWALSPWVQLALTANFVQLLQFHLIFSIRFHFKFSFISRQVYLIEIFLRKFFFYIYNLHFIKQKIYSH